MTTAVDVIIVSFNTRALLIDCLDSLQSSDDPALGNVIVVDNASSDGSVDAVRSAHPRAEAIQLDRNLGFAAANNVGLRRATAPLVLLLNSDTLVPAGSVGRLADRLLATGAVAAGPRLVNADGHPEVSFGRMLSPAAEAAQAIRVRLAQGGSGFARRLVERHLATERTVDWVSGACLMVRRDAAIAAGLLDERFFMYEEDVDFCAALRAAGGRILFTPAVEVVHLRGRSPRGEATPGPSHYDASHVAFYEKHAPGWAPYLRAWLRVRGRVVR